VFEKVWEGMADGGGDAGSSAVFSSSDVLCVGREFLSAPQSAFWIGLESDDEPVSTLGNTAESARASAPTSGAVILGVETRRVGRELHIPRV